MQDMTYAIRIAFPDTKSLKMTEDDQTVLHSPLSQTLTRDEKSVDVEIYDDGNDGWILEVVDHCGNSTVWQLPFKTDTDALTEALKTIEEDGIESLIGQPPASPKTTTSQTMVPLSDEEMDELGDFLMSDATSDDSMMLDCLDGYLTAIVSGPVMLRPSVWLPRIWGPVVSDQPIFENFAQAERITSLIMRHFNCIASTLQNEPDAFEPVFDITVYPDDPREYVDGEMWAYGYFTGIDLQDAAWEPLFDDPASDKIFGPLYLLGADDVSDKEDALTEDPAQREDLTKQIPEIVAWIYRFWQPYRQAIASTYKREQPKTGRNELCPCGSGKKFKKCCGSSRVLH